MLHYFKDVFQFSYQISAHNQVIKLVIDLENLLNIRIVECQKITFQSSVAKTCLQLSESSLVLLRKIQYDYAKIERFIDCYRLKKNSEAVLICHKFLSYYLLGFLYNLKVIVKAHENLYAVSQQGHFGSELPLITIDSFTLNKFNHCYNSLFAKILLNASIFNSTELSANFYQCHKWHQNLIASLLKLDDPVITKLIIELCADEDLGYSQVLFDIHKYEILTELYAKDDHEGLLASQLFFRKWSRVETKGEADKYLPFFKGGRDVSEHGDFLR